VPIATLTSKGQITLPLAVRTSLSLIAGQKLDFLADGDGFRLVALKTDMSELRGRFAGRVSAPVSLAEMGSAIAAGATGRAAQRKR
jgi:antitoxin PrlF